MTRFIPFLTSLINPALVYRIDRVTDTVTFTTLVAGLPAGNLQTQDFVFADEATAIAALDDFVAAARTYALEDAIAAVTSGITANESLTRGAINNPNLGDIEDRVAALSANIVLGAQAVVDAYEDAL